MNIAGSLAATTIGVTLLLLARERLASRQSAKALAAAIETQRAEAAKLDAIVDCMPDGLLVVDAELRVVKWNRHLLTFTGIPEGVICVGLDLAEILRAQAEAGEFGKVIVQAEVDRRMALFRSGTFAGTIERKRPDGGMLELRRSPMAGGGFVTLYTDVTAHHRADEQLRQAQKMEAVGQLTGGVAHDFNNSLTVIMGNLELALRAASASDLVGVDRSIRRAHGGATRAAHVTQSLLAFARKQVLKVQPIDANKLVSETSELIRHAIGAGVELETVLAADVWDVSSDENQLENALINLAINARDAMPEGGKLTIETANAHLDHTYAAQHAEVIAGQYVMIAVSDSGTGMTDGAAERAFEPFFTTKDVGKGSGLGLSQVFGFIKQSSGHVKIYSKLGAGTTVKLFLPRDTTVDLESATTKMTSLAPDLPEALDHECVLVVEDDEYVLTYTTNALESLGYQVIGTKDAKSAIAVLESSTRLKLLFVDVELPGMNGPDLALEAVRLRPSLAVLFTTGYTPNAMVHQNTLKPGARMLSKPFAMLELATTLRELLDVETGEPVA